MPWFLLWLWFSSACGTPLPVRRRCLITAYSRFQISIWWCSSFDGMRHSTPSQTELFHYCIFKRPNLDLIQLWRHGMIYQPLLWKCLSVFLPTLHFLFAFFKSFVGAMSALAEQHCCVKCSCPQFVAQDLLPPSYIPVPWFVSCLTLETIIHHNKWCHTYRSPMHHMSSAVLAMILGGPICQFWLQGYICHPPRARVVIQEWDALVIIQWLSPLTCLSYLHWCAILQSDVAWSFVSPCVCTIPWSEHDPVWYDHTSFRPKYTLSHYLWD